MSRRKQKWKEGKIRNNQELLGGFPDKVQKMMGKEGATFETATREEDKLSHAVIQVAKPFLDQDPDLFEKILMVAITAWNLSFHPDEDREKRMWEFIEKFGRTPEDRQGFRHILETLLTRKREMFPHDDRYIVNFQFSEDPDRNILNVAGLHIPGGVLDPRDLDGEGCPDGGESRSND